MLLTNVTTIWWNFFFFKWDKKNYSFYKNENSYIFATCRHDKLIECEKKLYPRGEYNGDSIIQHGLPKHQHVQDWINIQGLEDCQRGNWVHSRYQGTKSKTFNHIELVRYLCLRTEGKSFTSSGVLKFRRATKYSHIPVPEDRLLPQQSQQKWRYQTQQTQEWNQCYGKNFPGKESGWWWQKIKAIYIYCIFKSIKNYK